MERWRGHKALVTGASTGIGFAIVESLAKSGLTVIACARNIAKIEELAKNLGNGQGKVYAIKCDLTNEDEILRMFKTIEEKFRYVDILVNNAGLGHPDDLMNGRTEKWRGMIDLNVIGLSICTREALRLMDKNHIDDGHVININSMAGHDVPTAINMVHFYSATKHMVTALTKALNSELRQKKSKIRVTSISPGGVETEFLKTTLADSTPAQLQEMMALKAQFAMLNAVDIANAVLYVIGTPAHVCIRELIISPTEQPPL